MTRYHACAGNVRGVHQKSPELFISNYDPATTTAPPREASAVPDEVVVAPMP